MSSCMEAKYRTYVTLQQMIEFAFIDERTPDNAGHPKLLPTSVDEVCNAQKVYGDQAMPYPDKYTEEFDLFLAIKLILTPTFAVISFAFTVPLVLKRIVEEKQ